MEIAKDYQLGPVYTPASLARPTLMLPSPNGGASWQGAAVDPETGYLYVGSATTPRILTLRQDPRISSMDYIGSSRWRPEIFPQGLPLTKPPWGRITAIDLNTGDQVWVIPNGGTPEGVRNHPALEGVEFPRTGSADASGLLVTKTLLFSGSSGLHSSLPPGQGSPYLLAIDKGTGELVFEVELPGGLRPTAVPMTYAVEGKQYIVVAAGAAPPATSGRVPAALVALTLP